MPSTFLENSLIQGWRNHGDPSGETTCGERSRTAAATSRGARDPKSSFPATEPGSGCWSGCFALMTPPSLPCLRSLALQGCAIPHRCALAAVRWPTAQRSFRRDRNGMRRSCVQLRWPRDSADTGPVQRIEQLLRASLFLSSSITTAPRVLTALRYVKVNPYDMPSGPCGRQAQDTLPVDRVYDPLISVIM